MRTICLLSILIIGMQTNLKAQSSDSKKEIKPTIREVEKIQLVYYNNTGPYQQAFNNFGQLMGYLQQNQIPMGAFSLGIFYDDPETVAANKLRSEIGFMVKEFVEGSETYKYKEIPAGKAVTMKYKSWEDIFPAYQAISEYIAENKLKTAPYSVEIYYSADPNVVDAEILMFLED